MLIFHPNSELAESEWGAEPVDRKNLLATLDNSGAVLEAQKLDTTLPQSSSGFHVSSEAQELIIQQPASSTSVQVYEALRLEVTPPTFPHVVISEAPPIRQAKLENPLKEARNASSGGCGLSLKLGKQRKGNLKRDQTKESVDGNVYGAPSTRKTEELQYGFT